MSDENEELELEKQKKKEKRQENTQKNVARHQALWTAWFENSIEIDKQLLILSTAALGFLVFIHDDLKGAWEKNLLLFASFFFVVTIIMILRTFYISQEYIGAAIKKNKAEEDKLNAKSIRLNIASLITFGLGFSLTFLMMLVKLGILAVIFTFLAMLFKLDLIL